jgi:hypothetical protein
MDIFVVTADGFIHTREGFAHSIRTGVLAGMRTKSLVPIAVIAAALSVTSKTTLLAELEMNVIE